MKQTLFLSGLILIAVSGPAVLADDEDQNCKLTVRIINNDGDRKVNVLTKSAVSKADCKQQGEEIKAEELKKEDVKSVVVSAGFKEKRP